MGAEAVITKITEIYSVANVGKWTEFWLDEPVELIDGQPERRFDLCSKTGYYQQAIEKAGLYDEIRNNGIRGKKLRWVQIGANWEIDCFVDELGYEVKDGKFKTDYNIPVTYEGKTVGWSNGDQSSNIIITDDDFKREFQVMSARPIGISSRATGKIADDGTQ